MDYALNYVHGASLLITEGLNEMSDGPDTKAADLIQFGLNILMDLKAVLSQRQDCHMDKPLKAPDNASE